LRTEDIHTKDDEIIGTSAMGDAVVKMIKNQAN